MIRHGQEALHGIAAPLVGVGILVRHRTLWLPAILPSGIGLVWSVLALLQYASGALQGGFLGWIGFVFVAGFAVLIVTIQVIIAVLSPLLDLVAERTEVALGLEGPRIGSGLTARVWSALVEALELLVFKLVLGFLAFLIGLVPLVGFPVAALLVGLALALDFLDYPMSRRLWPLSEKRRWVRLHPAAAVAFSLTCYVLLLVPGLGGLFLAPSVVGGTWLFGRTARGVSGSGRSSLPSEPHRTDAVPPARSSPRRDTGR